jgi:hypothetical protein
VLGGEGVRAVGGDVGESDEGEGGDGTPGEAFVREGRGAPSHADVQGGTACDDVREALHEQGQEQPGHRGRRLGDQCEDRTEAERRDQGEQDGLPLHRRASELRSAREDHAEHGDGDPGGLEQPGAFAEDEPDPDGHGHAQGGER